MSKEDVDKIFIDFVNDCSIDVGKKLLAVISEENNNRMKDTPSDLKRMIHNAAIFELLKIVNFPESVLEVDDEELFLQGYELYADTFREIFMEMLESFRTWKPEE